MKLVYRLHVEILEGRGTAVPEECDLVLKVDSTAGCGCAPAAGDRVLLPGVSGTGHCMVEVRQRVFDPSGGSVTIHLDDVRPEVHFGTLVRPVTYAFRDSLLKAGWTEAWRED